MTSRIPIFILLALACGMWAPLRAADDNVTFRSDVSLVRVDAQVVDRGNRAITGLRAEDFVLLEQGRPQQIRNFETENMPVDVLLLLDVSASMRPHVERIARAAHEAMRVLAPQDRIAIMVFDRSTRVRLPFRNSREDVEREFERLLRQETFNGGTDITRGLLDAAAYIGREGRRDARRAIVILTDDQTERDRNEAAVSRALSNSDTILSALIAPDAMRGGYGSRGSGPPGSGGSWPRGPMGGPLGGIILGRRRGPYGVPGGGGMGSHTQSAGTAAIARESGGDSMPVDDAYALQDMLARIRQRYALHFYLPQGVQPGQERGIEVELADAARRRYPDAAVRYRRVYMAPGASPNSGTVVTQPAVVNRSDSSPRSSVPADNDQPPILRRRPATMPDGPREGPLPIDGDGGLPHAPETASPAAPVAPNPAQPGWRRADTGEAKPKPSETDNSSKGGWRRAKPEEKK